MGTLITLSDSEWLPFEDSDGSAVLSTSAKRAVCHSVGANGYPVLLTQLASDPAHPFTAGQMVFTAETIQLRGSTPFEFAHSDDYPRSELDLFNTPIGHTVHSGGFYLPDYRVPLEWRIVIQEATPNNSLEIELFRPDHAEIDADDRTDVAITIDNDTDENTPAAFTISDGVSTPAGGRGGVVMRWNLTDAQLLLLQPVNAMSERIYNKIGITIQSGATTPVITYSAYDETHPTREQAEYLLRNGQTIGLQAPSSGGWYARATRATTVGATKIYVGD